MHDAPIFVPDFGKAIGFNAVGVVVVIVGVVAGCIRCHRRC